jgi:hypothetical protein
MRPIVLPHTPLNPRQIRSESSSERRRRQRASSHGAPVVKEWIAHSRACRAP